MIIAQWTACVMLAVGGWVFTGKAASIAVRDGDKRACCIYLALSILSIAAAIAVRP